MSDPSEVPPRRGLFGRLKTGLKRTQERFQLRIREVFSGRTKVDNDLYEDLEAALLEADVGLPTTGRLLKALAVRVRDERIEEPERVRGLLREELERILVRPAPAVAGSGTARPRVTLLIGVNGVGKTTTLGKLAHWHARAGRRVVVAAADTFRAAALEQLAVWVDRAGARLVAHREGADPAAVAFDALETTLARGEDELLIDTAGRLHTKDNLMAELEKMRRVIGKRLPGAPHEVLLVLDATTGQNALAQARQFALRIGVTGLVVTKVDGTAKGGVVVAIAAELDLPVLYLGTGEGIDDLAEFDAAMFAEALFS